MKILAVDSSGLVASVAVVEDDILLAEYTMNYKKTHSQTLLPMLNEVKQMIDLDLNTIDYLAVAAGPGSFPHTVMELAGLKNLAENAPAEYFKCSREWLALQKPDFLIWTVSGIPFKSAGIWKDFPESIVISNLNHDIVLRPGPRLFDGIRHLRNAVETRQNPR